MKKSFKVLLGILATLIVAYFFGPKAPEIRLDPKIVPIEVGIKEVERFVLEKEGQYTDLKPDNQAKVIWADSSGEKTPYALVYLHGFSASHGEGDPIHKEFGERYGMNIYLSRLDDHGINEENALLDMTPSSLLHSAKEAISIGNILGEKVIVMSCSTGSTLSLYLAAHNPEYIEAQILFSPNIDIADPASHLLDGPWGLFLLRMFEGGDFHRWEAPEEAQSYWTTSYRIEALIDLRQLIDATMTPAVFSEVNQPTLVLRYFNSESEQDKVVSVEAMDKMFATLGTPDHLKIMYNVPEATQHVFVSKHYQSDLTSVRLFTFEFAENVLNLKPVL